MWLYAFLFELPGEVEFIYISLIYIELPAFREQILSFVQFVIIIVLYFFLKYLRTCH